MGVTSVPDVETAFKLLFSLIFKIFKPLYNIYLTKLNCILDRQRLSCIAQPSQVNKGICSVTLHRHDAQIATKVPSVRTD